MMGLPNWLRKREGDFDMTQDEVPVPQIAYMPEPKRIEITTDDDHAAAVVVQAHNYIEQWKQERVTQQKTIEELKQETEELIEQLKREQRKSGLLELDLAAAANDLQTQQAQIEEYRRFMSIWKEMSDKTRQCFDKFGVQSPPKKERKHAKATKTERQATNQPTSEDRPTAEKPHKV